MRSKFENIAVFKACGGGMDKDLVGCLFRLPTSNSPAPPPRCGVLFTPAMDRVVAAYSHQFSRYRRATSGDTDDPETGCNGWGVITQSANGCNLPDAREKVLCGENKARHAWLQETDGTLATPSQRGKAVAFTKKQMLRST